MIKTTQKPILKKLQEKLSKLPDFTISACFFPPIIEVSHAIEGVRINGEQGLANILTAKRAFDSNEKSLLEDLSYLKKYVKKYQKIKSEFDNSYAKNFKNCPYCKGHQHDQNNAHCSFGKCNSKKHTMSWDDCTFCYGFGIIENHKVEG